MPTLPEFVVSPGPGEPLDWYQQLYLEELERQREEEQRRAFAPPEPVVAPEVPVETPGAVPVGFMVAISNVLGRLIPILVPQPTGPREHDELDEFDVMWTPPPPDKPPPAATDPIMPPNWNDLVEWPGTPTYVPITPINLGEPIEMPVGEPEFVVSPPKPTLRPIIEVPLGDYDVGIDLGPGPTYAPTGTPRSDPVAPGLDDYLEPLRVPEPDRPGTTSPDLFGAPLPDWIRDPFSDPFTPSPVPSPPGTQPRAPTIPDFLTPEFTPDVVPEPTLPQFQPEKPRDADTCQCANKKKKKKKRKDREVCYRGTYVETKRGLTKKRLEQVPCDGARSRSTGSKPKQPKLKPGQFPGLGFIGQSLTSDQWLDLASSAVKEFAPILQDYLRDRSKKKAAKPKKKRNRKAKTKVPRLPGTTYTTPFPIDFGG